MTAIYNFIGGQNAFHQNNQNSTSPLAIEIDKKQLLKKEK